MWFIDLLKLVYTAMTEGKLSLLIMAAIVIGAGYLIWHFTANIPMVVLCCLGVILIWQLVCLPKRILAAIKGAHKDSECYRDKVSPIIRYLLSKAIIDMDADRAFITEGHNGSASLANMSFLYMDITYLETAVVKDWISFDYKNLSTSIFPCFHYIADKGSFIGSIEDLEKVDNKICHIIRGNGTNYLVAISLNDKQNKCIGTLVVTYLNKPEMSDGDIEHKAMELANKIERILSVKLSDKELSSMM